MSYVFLVILAVTVITALLPGMDLLSPTRIYISIYSLLLSIYCLDLSRLQTPWSDSSIMLFCGASGLFLTGGFWIWMTTRIKFPDWKLDFARMRAALAGDAETVDWSWFIRVWLVCAAGFVVSFLVSAAVVKGIPALMHDPDNARIKFFSATMITNYGIFLGPLSLMLGTEIYLFAKIDPIQRRRVLAGVLGILVLYLTIVTRYDLFRFLIFGVVLYHYGKKRLNLIHLGTGLGLAVALFMVGFLVRVNVDAIGSFNEIVKVKLPHRWAWASNFYAYLANDFWNFDYAIQKYVDGEHHYPFQYGLGLFRALLWNLRLEGQLAAAYGFDSIMNESAMKLKGFNTVLYVWHLYKDFGLFGVFVIPFVAGLVAAKYYFNTMLRPTLFRLSLWGIFTGMIMLSYHAPLWELWFVYLNLIVLIVAHRKVRLA